MKRHSSRLAAAMLLAACIAASVGCYPAYNNGSVYNDGAVYSQDAKGYSDPQQPYPQQSPSYAGVDPGLVVAGVAAVGLLGYAIGNNNGSHHHSYYGSGYYRPAFYGRGYYGPCR